MTRSGEHAPWCDINAQRENDNAARVPRCDCRERGWKPGGECVTAPTDPARKPADEDEAAARYVRDKLARIYGRRTGPEEIEAAQAWLSEYLRDFRATARAEAEQKLSTVVEHLGRVNRELRTAREQGRQAGAEEMREACAKVVGYRAQQARAEVAQFGIKQTGSPIMVTAAVLEDAERALRALTLPEPGK